MKYAQLRPGRAFRPLRATLYYLQRIVTPIWLRRVVISVVSAIVRLRQGNGESDVPGVSGAEMTMLADRLERDGLVELGTLLDADQCRAIHAYLANKLLDDRDCRRPGFILSEAPANVRLADYSLNDVAGCPHILALANHPALLAMAQRYIGCKPTLSGMGIRWSFARTGEASSLQRFHRDSEDWRYFKVLVYLTDVDLAAGPHVYVRGSQQVRGAVRLRFFSDEEVRRRFGESNVVTVTGRAGFCFAVATAGVHRGTEPTAGKRLMLQLQYSLLPCFAYDLSLIHI